MNMSEERIACGYKIVLQYIPPLLLQALKLVGCNRTNGAMAWEEVFAERLWLRSKGV